MASKQSIPHKEADKSRQAANSGPNTKGTGPPWFFFGTPAPTASSEERAWFARGGSSAKERHPSPGEVPRWLEDYSWLDKLPPPGNKKVSDSSKGKVPNWSRDEVSRVAHSHLVENKRAAEKASGPKIQKIRSRTARAINRHQKRVLEKPFHKKCKRCLIEVHSAEDWHKHLTGRTHNRPRGKIEN